MFNTIEEYLDALKEAMQGSDAALVQDVLTDAREHLSMALGAMQEGTSGVNGTEALQAIIEQYGTPEEVATAYREIERRTSYSLKRAKESNSFWSRVLGVYIDPRTWGSLLFMFIALVTGILYFTWAVTGLSLSLSLMILIIGVPFAILFLISVRGLALLEGRLVEALLGERMPRRPLFAQPEAGWLDRLKTLITDKHTWLSILYMVVQMPLGLFYFSLNTILILLALTFMAAPFLQIFWKIPVISLEAGPVVVSPGGLVLMAIGGFVLLTLTMHMARTIGGLHARYAKWMLVS